MKATANGKAYQAGYDAYNQGYLAQANPYDGRTFYGREWKRGFAAARAEQLKMPVTDRKPEGTL